MERLFLVEERVIIVLNHSSFSLKRPIFVGCKL
jgi:hypothetical protein